MSIENSIQILIAFLTLVAVIIAAIGIYSTNKRSQESQDLQVILNLSKDFRENWDIKWRDALSKFENTENKEELPIETKKEIFSILNWIDWFGNLVNSGLFHRHEVFIDAVGPSIKRALDLTEKMIEEDEKKYGRRHWKGLVIVKKVIEVNLLKNGH